MAREYRLIALHRETKQYSFGDWRYQNAILSGSSVDSLLLHTPCGAAKASATVHRAETGVSGVRPERQLVDGCSDGGGGGTGGLVEHQLFTNTRPQVADSKCEPMSGVRRKSRHHRSTVIALLLLSSSSPPPMRRRGDGRPNCSASLCQPCLGPFATAHVPMRPLRLRVYLCCTCRRPICVCVTLTLRPEDRLWARLDHTN
ncbi:unnamed protein product [Protopolystoma xenopodis]|uniref:Uncharacterized protein n=1 Tax=Protopolystoma xenopodis TaxID=117903 RepID=A0A448XLR8_9PLAT|nr:unnamed protein product [Protopolystoma xenopodis]